jgi:hypothetical protein
MEEEETRDVRTIVYSPVLGMLPCRVVGANKTHYLVQVLGFGGTVNASREDVFELLEGWELCSGRIVPAEGNGAGQALAPATVPFEPEHVPVV